MKIEDKDFRVGDTVCTHKNKTGVIIHKDSGGGIAVDHDIPSKEACERVYHYEAGKQSHLMHGTWEEVFGNVKGVKPVRTVERFVNIYFIDGEVKPSPKLYISRQAAEDAAATDSVATAAPVKIPEDMI